MRGLAVVLLLAGCDPWFSMKGDVVDAAGRPVAGAHAALVCYGADQDTVETDAVGHFTYGRVGEFGNDCTVEIRPPGHRPVSFAVMSVCTRVSRHWFHDDMCAEVTVHATLR